MKKLIRVSTVAVSLDILLKGQLSFLNNYFNVIAISGNDEHLKNVSQREKVKTIAITISRKISIFNDIVSLIKLYFIFKKEKPFVVHSITPKAGLLSMFAAYLAHVPVRIHTFTGLIFPYKDGFLKKILILMDQMLCKFATHIIPEGNGVKNDLIVHKITKKPLNIIANGNVNGIDLDYFNLNQLSLIELDALKNELNIKTDDFVFIYVGRLVKDKGINELINSFVNLQLQYNNIKLILVGSFEHDLDPLESSTLQLINKNSNIISVGFKKDVRPYYAISNCFVFPSYREGFPNVVLQASAMELPCIVTNISGSNEIIIENVNGKIIPVKNTFELEHTMKQFYLDKELLNLCKINSRKIILEKFDQKLVWDELLLFYNKTIDSKVN